MHEKRNHTIVPLVELKAVFGEEVIDLLSSFKCKLDADIEKFLTTTALEFEDTQKARTYLVCDTNRLRNGEFVIMGYFALSLKVLILPEEMSNRNRKALDGFRGKIHGVPVREIPCYLIGQLGRNSAITSDSISGTLLLEHAISVIEQAVDAVGGRWILVECHNEDGLISFYEKNQFRHILNKPDNDVPMVQMIRRV